jgi:hypothetical protein
MSSQYKLSIGVVGVRCDVLEKEVQLSWTLNQPAVLACDWAASPNITIEEVTVRPQKVDTWKQKSSSQNAFSDEDDKQNNSYVCCLVCDELSTQIHSEASKASHAAGSFQAGNTIGSSSGI